MRKLLPWTQLCMCSAFECVCVCPYQQIYFINPMLGGYRIHINQCVICWEHRKPTNAFLALSSCESISLYEWTARSPLTSFLSSVSSSCHSSHLSLCFLSVHISIFLHVDLNLLMIIQSFCFCQNTALLYWCFCSDGLD